MEFRKEWLYKSSFVPPRTRRRQKQRELERAAMQTKRQRQNEPDNSNQDPTLVPLIPAAGQTIHKESSEDVSLPRTDSGIADLPSPSSVYSSRETDVSSASDDDTDRSIPGCDPLTETASEDTSDTDNDMQAGQQQDDSSSSTAEDEVEDDANPFLSRPLSDSTSTTEGDALLMCLALGLRHSLSWAAIVDILSMINFLFDREVVKATKYFFLKYMEGGKQDTIFHLYCSYCERYLGTKQDIIDNQMVACHCGTTLKDINDASTYFLSLNLNNQIKELLSDHKFLKATSYRFTRKKINQDAYEDIYDGEVYRSLSGPGQVLSERYNFSYCFNTDGFPVGGKSGKQTCWPIYLQLNELPPELRSKYMLLAGIYVGKKDPNMKIFMYPFVEEANVLSSTGVDWSLNGTPMNSKVIPICACVDSPARAKILNMSQFNGWYGCTLCHCKAESISSGLRYTIPLTGLYERTHEEILVNAAQAHANIRLVQNKKNRSVQGVKGLTPIHSMSYIDLVKGIRPDFMHSKLLGNAKHLTSIFYSMAAKPYFIGSDVRMDAINQRLLSIKPPSSIMRPPRPIQQINLWKATEWRSWLLFYGMVCLHGIIPNKYIVHFSMLSTSVHIILQKSIQPDDLDRAHGLLLRFVNLYQEYFGKDAMVFNVHLLLHTKRDIECLGPAWTNTAFGFEGANKTLVQFKKSTSSIAKEIARKYLTFKALPTICQKFATSDNALKFCEKMSGRSLQTFCRVGQILLVGQGQTYVLDPEEFDVLQRSMMLNFREVLSYERFIYNGIRFSTGSYTRSKKHDDSFLCIRGELKGRIQKICYLSEENGPSIVLFVRELILSDGPLGNDEYGKYCPVKTIDTEGSLLVVRPQDITTQCVAMFLENGNFICDMPYGCYGDS